MSFATNVKNEVTQYRGTKTENIALLCAFIRNSGTYNENKLILTTENAKVAKNIYSLIKELYDVPTYITQRKGYNLAKNNIYDMIVEKNIEIILEDLSIYKNNKYVIKPSDYIVCGEEEKRAYLLGAFLSRGSINDPKTSRYHLEFLIEKKEEAQFISNLLNSFNLNSKVLLRDKGYMVYIKEAEKIGDFLRIIYASQAVMYYEDIRIYRDHKNMTNRLNNCEQANIDKVIATANSQIEDILFVQENDLFDLLDDKVKEVAEYRIKYPDSSLQELSDIITYETGKELSKSGLIHRLKKIKQLKDRVEKK